MATSGTSVFNLTTDDIVTEAYESIGLLAPTGRDLKTARRSLGLLFQELANRNVFAFQMQHLTLSVLENVYTYQLPQNVIDIDNVRIVVNDTEVEMTRYSAYDYAMIPTKSTTGRPTTFYVDRQRDLITLYIWPVPDQAYTIKYDATRRIQDVGAYTNEIDVPVRVLPAVVAGLAYRVALKQPQFDATRLGVLKGYFEEQISLAIDEDRDRTSTFMFPQFRRRR